jgi:hypothetical protein
VREIPAPLVESQIEAAEGAAERLRGRGCHPRESGTGGAGGERLESIPE